MCTRPRQLPNKCEWKRGDQIDPERRHPTLKIRTTNTNSMAVRDFDRITRLVLRNLKTQKVMDSGDRYRIT